MSCNKLFTNFTHPEIKQKRTDTDGWADWTVFFIRRQREGGMGERWEAEAEERGRSWRAPVYCDSWLLQITTKPLEHLRSGRCMARVPLQHDLISCQGLDARSRAEYHILTIIPTDRIKNSVWLTKIISPSCVCTQMHMCVSTLATPTPPPLFSSCAWLLWPDKFSI